MQNYIWPLAITAALIGVLTFGIPLLLREFFPWRNLYNQRRSSPPVKTASYAGRTVLITGANGAFGSRAAKIFAERDAETIVLVDVKDCAEVKQEIEVQSAARKNGWKPNVLVWQVDMMTFAGCRELAEKAKELKALDHALMTMGILSFKRKESPEGWETSVQVNYLSNALLSLLLLPLLKSSSSNPNPPCLTFVTTFGIYPAGPTMSVPRTGSYLKRMSNNKDGMAQGHQYGRSKGLLLYFARELASRVAAAQSKGGLRKVTICSADPGTAWTNLTSPNAGQLIPRLITNFGARDPQICATALVNGVSSPAEANGKVVMDFDYGDYPPFMSRKAGRRAQERVWAETREELGAKAPEVKKVYEVLDAR